MSTILNEMQFELLPSMNAASGTVFGIGSDVSINEDGFNPGEDNWTDEDQENPSRGGTTFGRDQLQGANWQFDLHVNRDDVAGAVESLSAFKTAWRAKDIRSTPGAVLPLRYRINDRYRRVYGRPRRLAAPPSNLILSGYVPVSVDFICADAYTYDDEATSTMLTFNLGSAGGFVFPAVFPISTASVGAQANGIFVGGDATTYPVVKFTGPVGNPGLTLDDWSLQFNGLTIPAGRSITVDLRPWALTALGDDGTSYAGYLDPRQSMKDMTFEPGPRQLNFSGAWQGTLATCEVTWFNAYNSL